MTLKNFGVPLADGTKMPMLMPIYKYRFRVTHCPSFVTSNMVSVDFDMVNHKINMVVRVNVDPASFQDAMDFGRYGSFAIEMMDGGNDTSFYSLAPTQVKLVKHDFGLEYASSEPANHTYEWSYVDLDLYVPESKVPENQLPPKVDEFLTPAEAMEKLTKAPVSANTDNDIGESRTAGC